MTFNGIGRRFSTQNERQYEDIGRFWDEMAGIFGRETLLGLGWNWNDEGLMYAIGRIGQLFGCEMPGMEKFSILLPDDGWEHLSGETDRLAEIYGKIYWNGPLTYEIERFSDDGTCCIDVYREQK